jgi:hypothetical protein
MPAPAARGPIGRVPDQAPLNLIASKAPPSSPIGEAVGDALFNYPARQHPAERLPWQLDG